MPLKEVALYIFAVVMEAVARKFVTNARVKAAGYREIAAIIK